MLLISSPENHFDAGLPELRAEVPLVEGVLLVVLVHHEGHDERARRRDAVRLAVDARRVRDRGREAPRRRVRAEPMFL